VDHESIEGENGGGPLIQEEEVTDQQVRRLVVKVMRKRHKRKRKPEENVNISVQDIEVSKTGNSMISQLPQGKKKLLRSVSPVLSQYESTLPEESAREKKLRDAAAESECGRKFTKFLEKRHHFPPKFLLGESWNR
jgi:hypothetical protein